MAVLNQSSNDKESNSPYSMTEEILKEASSQYNYGRFSTQFYAAFVGAFCWGTTIGVSSAASDLYFRDNPNERNIQFLNNLAGMLPLGSLIGLYPLAYFIAYKGRKATFYLYSLLYIISTLVQASNYTKSPLLTLFLRAFFGLVYYIDGGIFLSESVDFKLRKYFLIWFQVSITLGISITHCLVFISIEPWISLTCGLIAALHYILIFTLPESPVFLFGTSEKKAAEAVTWYRGSSNIYMEMHKIQKDHEHQLLYRQTGSYMITARTVIIGLSRILLLTFFQCNSGYFIYVFHSISLWQKVDVVGPQYETFLVPGCLVVSKLLCRLFQIKFNLGIRFPLILSSFFVSTQLCLLSIYLTLNKIFDINFGGTLPPLILIGIGIFGADFGLNDVPPVLINDYMPFQVLAKAKLIYQFFLFLFIFINVRSFGALLDVLPLNVIFACFAVISIIGTIFIIKFIIETKNKSLVQIQLELGGNPVGNRSFVYYSD